MLGAAAFESDEAGHQFFEKRVRPILVEHCYDCHSQAGGKVKGGLLLDSRDGWVRGGDSGDVVVPGDVDASLLITAVRYKDNDFQMPPKYRLADSEIAYLEQWVAGGAPDPRTEDAPVTDRVIDIEAGRSFWSLKKPIKQAPPTVADIRWPQTDLDRFLLATLESKGLKPAQPASREILIRRASFDLTGLPPTIKQIDAFVSDPHEDNIAFANVVDQLLASPQFGERWGRHWLDVVRFGESMGRTRNYPFPYAWRYRNYVIDAFNSDMPFDQFLTEQLAGDLLADTGTAEEIDRLHIATGFLALGSHDLNERDKKKFKMDMVDEQVDVTSRAFMALTTGCARCHDHKFDPIPTEDYYALAGIFASTDTRMGYGNRQGGNRSDFLPEKYIALKSVREGDGVEDAAQATTRESPGLAKARQKQNKLRRQLKAAQKSKNPESKRLAKRLQAQIKRQAKQLAKLEKSGGKPLPENYAVGALEAKSIERCRVHLRGDVNKLGDPVPRGFLSVISTPDCNPVPDERSGRLELARWLAHPDHPLTARVFANRVWHHLFGHGIVRTVDNFGETGARPSNRALLDHLALQLTEHGWSIKKLIREVMLSRAYQMSSELSDDNFAIDPNNDLFWRMNLRRLEIEAIRDAMFAVSGTLKLDRPEGSPLMKVAIGEMRNAARILQANATARLRSVYLPVVRGHLPEEFEVFDFAEPSQVIGRRDITTVSPQALYFMNNPLVLDLSQTTAEQLLKINGVDDQQRLQRLYRATLGRPATDSELAMGLEYVQAAATPIVGWAGVAANPLCFRRVPLSPLTMNRNAPYHNAVPQSRRGSA